MGWRKMGGVSAIPVSLSLINACKPLYFVSTAASHHGNTPDGDGNIFLHTYLQTHLLAVDQ